MVKSISITDILASVFTILKKMALPIAVLVEDSAENNVARASSRIAYA